MSRLESAQHVISSQFCCNDGFFLNLSWVMLRLAAPFCNLGSQKLHVSAIDPIYCSANQETVQAWNSGLADFTTESKLVSSNHGQYTCTCISTVHVYTYTCTCMHVCTCMYMYMYVPVYVCIYVHVHVHVYMYIIN